MRYRYLLALVWIAAAPGAPGCACRRSAEPVPVHTASAGVASSEGAGGAPGPVAQRPPDALRTEAQCRACQGEFRAHGLDPTPRCVCGTSDAGKRCRGKDDCEGDCIGDEKEREVVDPGPPPRGYFIGRCSRLRTTFGCNVLLGPKGPPVRLDQPPEQLCVD